jgi:hypothetical protein
MSQDIDLIPAHNKVQYEAVVDLLCNIASEKKKINDKIFIISSAYDKIYKKYNMFSLSLLILSSITTAFEALRLSTVDLLNKLEVTDIDSVSFVMNTLILTLGTVITILSGIVRFRNYRETLEQLKDIQNQLIGFRDKYKKKMHKVLNLLSIDNLSTNDVSELRKKMEEYDTSITNINISQHLRNDEILRYTKYKAQFEIEMKKVLVDKIQALKMYETEKGITTTTLFDIPNIDNTNKYAFVKNLKEVFLKIEEDDELVEYGFA